MQPKYQLGQQQHKVTPLRRGRSIDIDIDGHRVEARLLQQQENRLELCIDGVNWLAHFAQQGSELFLHLGGRNWRLRAIDEFGDLDLVKGGGEGAVRAPMPGVVVEVSVQAGQRVAAGQSLVLIESMKLQTDIRAPIDGVVTQLALAAGASFERGALLVEIAAEESGT
jgi:acetyl/propionyl-CoA carboxylase alpha subunit